MSMTLEEAISLFERHVELSKEAKLPETQEYYGQLAEWLRILKKAKFEYDEAWRIITHPTPDITSYDKDRAQVILDTFRDSLGRMENVDD